MTAPGVWVVIAAYREGAVIGDVIADVKTANCRLVVVDDGSPDDTADRARNSGAIVVEHPVNLGQGAALQTGIEFALSEGAEVIVTFDADGQHRAADILVLIDALKAHNADFALGNRFLGRAIDMPASRHLLLRAATTFTRLTTGLRIGDTHNGLRAMTRRGAQRISLKQNRMAHASEILHQIAHSGLNYVEVPVTIAYSDYSRAKGQTIGDALGILIDLIARRLQR